MTPLSWPVAMSLAPVSGNARLLSIPRETGPARRFFFAKRITRPKLDEEISCIKPLFAGSTNTEDDRRSYKGTDMATNPMSGFIQRLRRTLFVRDRAGLTDGQLLTDYLSGLEETSLAALVHRHGPMVWGVCRRVLRNYHDAEDAFQATFLVLVRKAAALESRELLANWLYGVAHQTALKARATAAKRNERERQMTEMPEPAVADPGIWRDLQPL